MDTIGGFWAGAAALHGRLDLDALALAMGGWRELARCGVDDLLQAGIDLRTARTWLTTPPLQTRGFAITRLCATYPPILRTVPDAPPVLFVEGDATALQRAAIAIVGTRRCSPYGASAAHRIAHAAASAGLAVVSGLARGIDTAAHKGALTAKGPTIAVLGHGLAHTAPPSNGRLRKAIVEGGGLLLTTWPDALPPARWTFPARNRWIAALARRLVVVEAPERSGALITAEQLLELGRDEDLFVLPGPLGEETWRGSAALLAMGVQPLSTVEAFVGELVGGAQRPRETPPDWLSALFGGASVDEAARICGRTAIEVLRTLVRLELEGEVVKLPGGRYAAGGGVP
ncbi:MAG: DNA-processing protein DprA [Myxococcota bacterium]